MRGGETEKCGAMARFIGVRKVYLLRWIMFNNESKRTRTVVMVRFDTGYSLS